MLPRLIFSLLLVNWLLPAANEITVASPDGGVRFRLGSSSDGHLQFSIAFRDKAILDPSPIGITVDGVDLAAGAQIGASETYKVDETYPWYGSVSRIRNHCNGAKVAVKHPRSGTAYTLEIRVYDDGAAFRHLVPGKGSRTPDEATAFRVPDRSILWYHDLENHYEGSHQRAGLAAVPKNQWAAPPLTFRLPDNAGYASITEGNLVGYSGMALQADGEGSFFARLGHSVPASYPFRLRYKQDVARLTKPATITGPITTPWRVVMVGADLNALVNCMIVPNVAPPPDKGLFPEGIRTSWIKPGRAVWAYLDGGERTLEGMKQFSKQASELGFEYNLLEGFWAKWPESQLKELVDYSRERGVKILIWRSRSAIGDPKARQELFDMCNRTGVAGVKIDFFDHEHKDVIDLYETILRDAARHKLIVDVHGANKPTGLERTWPNLLGFEGIRGMESRAPWSLQEVTLPFTRMLAGLADYTPTHFGAKLGDTTWPHQVANAVILTAPLLCYAANPASILTNPTAEVIRTIPSVWDQTIALPLSDIGVTAALARRKGDSWFVAVTNGPYARTAKLDLSFLGNGAYRATLIRDTGEAAAVKIERATLTRTDSLQLDLRSGGGFVARFTR